MTRDLVEAAIGGLDAANGTNFAEPTRKTFLLLAVAARRQTEKSPPRRSLLYLSLALPFKNGRRREPRVELSLSRQSKGSQARRFGNVDLSTVVTEGGLQIAELLGDELERLFPALDASFQLRVLDGLQDLLEDWAWFVALGDEVVSPHERLGLDLFGRCLYHHAARHFVVGKVSVARQTIQAM